MKSKEKINVGTILIGIFLVLFPFISYCHVEFLGEKSREVFTHYDGYIYDFFLYYKEVVFLWLCVVLIVLLLLEVITQKKNERTGVFTKNARILWIFTGLTILLVVASAIRAYVQGNTESLMFGTSVDYEGVLVLLAYPAMFLSGYHFFFKKSQRHILERSLLVLMVLIGILSLVEYYIEPIYQLPFMKYIIAPKQYRELAGALENVIYKGQVTLGSYNSGYFGGLCAMLFPVSLGFVYSAKKPVERMAKAFISVGVLFGLVTSTSTGALYAVVFAIVMGIVVLVVIDLFEKKSRQNGFDNHNTSDNEKHSTIIYSVLSVLGGIVIFCIVAVVLSKGQLFSQIYKTIVHPDTVEKREDLFELSYLQIEGDTIVARNVTGQELNIKETAGYHTKLSGFEMYDENGEKLKTGFGEDVQGIELLFFEEPGYEGIICYMDNNILMLDFGYEQPVPFYVTDKGFYLVGKDETYIDKITQPKVVGMEEYYDVATGRGYTWVQSLPILKKNIFIGSGAGRFAYDFPQNEVVGLINTHGSSLFVIDKPHSWYIQMAINSGVVSVLIFIGMYVYLLVVTIKNHILTCKQNKCVDVLGVSLVVGVTAFLITGIVNDSIIAVNPIFWLLFGVSFVKNDKNNPC